MFDPVTLAVGATIAGLSYLAGKRSRRAPKAVTPACSCGHGPGMHDPKTRHCHGRTASMDGPLNCRCRSYDGPKPVEEFFASPMLPPEN